MAENQRTITAAKIRRASVTARREANKLDRQSLDELSELYKQAAELITESIFSYADDDGSLQLDILQELLNQTETHLDVLRNARNSLLDDRMLDAALLGISPFSDREIDLVATRLATAAVRQLKTFVGEDGLQLSDRIWRLDKHAKDITSNAISTAVIQGHSASQAALDFISRGVSVPGDIASKTKAANAAAVAKQATTAIMAKKDSPYSNAMRLFRTEINRAHGNAYQSAAFEHPDVIGTRFLLSPNHPRVDICDMHAKVNRYGLGPGVYPKDRNPWPAHPNTLSYVEAVFKDEVTDDDRAGKQDRITWLNSQSINRQNAILGHNKGWMLQEGILAENAIKTPWSILKEKLEKQNIELPVFRRFQPVQQVGLPGVKDKPVSEAFTIQGYRKQAEHVLKVIDSVHSDGILPLIPIKQTRSKQYSGAYRRYSVENGDQSVDINISSYSDHKEHTLTHEIGHFIDHKGFPDAGMTSTSHTMFKKFREIVADSPEIQWLKTLRDGPTLIKHPNGNIYEVPKGHIEYLLLEREIFARSYAQWITVKSKDELLLEQLNKMRNKVRDQAIPMPGQWDDEHFKPISNELDALFEQMGWLK